MNIRPLIIAAALSCGAALAASPNGTAKAPADTTNAAPAMHKSAARHDHKMAKHHRASRHAMGNRAERVAAPTTDVNDQERQQRMDEALAKYRQQHG